MEKRKTITVAILLAAALLASHVASAQPFTLDERINPTELLLVDYKKEDTKRKGRINVTNISQVKDTMFFFLKGLSMYSPVYFSLHAAKNGKQVKVKLCKNNWTSAEREGETGSDHQWNTKFKTEGDFGIMVIPEEVPASYTLLTWVGDEAKEIGMSSPFSNDAKAADKKGTTSSGKTFMQQYGLFGGIVLALLAVIAFLLIKRKK